MSITRRHIGNMNTKIKTLDTSIGCCCTGDICDYEFPKPSRKQRLNEWFDRRSLYYKIMMWISFQLIVIKGWIIIISWFMAILLIFALSSCDRSMNDSWLNPPSCHKKECAEAEGYKIEVPERFKAWVAERYPENREAAMKWRTWADVPRNGLRDEWWREEKAKLPIEL